MSEIVNETLNKEPLKSTKNDIHLIISSEIVNDETKNERTDYEGIEELADSIMEHGVQSPLHGYREKTGDKTLFHVTHGFRRARAIKLLLERGIEIKVPCLTKKKSECTPEQVIIEHFTLNSGMPLTTIEKANAIKKLTNYHYTPSQIAKVLSMTEMHVSNLLLLASAPMGVKKAIEAKKLSASTAMEILRENKDPNKVMEIVDTIIAEAMTSGKEKATKKDLVKTGNSKKANKEAKTKAEKKETAFRVIKNLAKKYEMDEKDQEKLEKLIDQF